MKALLLVILGLALAGDDPLKDRLAEITAFLKKAKTQEEFRAAVTDLQALAREACALNDYDLAVNALSQAVKITKPIKDAELGADVQARLDETKVLQQEFSKVKEALKTLESNPEDAVANLAAGRFLCLFKNDWNQGVPLFKKGKDSALKSLAEAEEGAAETPKDRAMVGDQWWTYAEKNPLFRERAYTWYRLAWPGLEGISRVQVKGKLKAASSNPKGKTNDGAPNGWSVGQIPNGQPWEGLAVDEKFFHRGKASFRITSAKQGILVTKEIHIADVREYEASLRVMTEGAIPQGLMGIACNRTDEDTLLFVPIDVPVDQPWWTNLKATFKAPLGTKFIRFVVRQTLLQDGMAVWLDDVSVKSKGSQEFMPNGGFEEKK